MNLFFGERTNGLFFPRTLLNVGIDNVFMCLIFARALMALFLNISCCIHKRRLRMKLTASHTLRLVPKTGCEKALAVCVLYPTW